MQFHGRRVQFNVVHGARDTDRSLLLHALCLHSSVSAVRHLPLWTDWTLAVPVAPPLPSDEHLNESIATRRRCRKH